MAKTTEQSILDLFARVFPRFASTTCMGNEFPHGVSKPLHIIILKYDYMNDYMYDYMKGVTNSVWEFVFLHVFASSSDCFILLTATVMIGKGSNFGFGSTTLN